MSRQRSFHALTTLALCALLLGGAASEATDPPAGNVDKHRGVSWEARGEITSEELAPLETIHANWIVQTPFGWQTTTDSPHVALALENVLWGELDEGLEATARWARARGIRTLLKPHIWLTRAGGEWRSDIAMRTEDDWEKWFASYRTFILHYARLAGRVGMEGLVIGTELHEAVKARPEDWRRIIREVREVYPGALTYAANWYEEYRDVSFWDELDFIGIQAYFPLSTDDSKTSVADLRKGWEPHKEAIAALQRQSRKPVLFTEIGYKSTPGATREPWKWLSREEARTAPEDLEVQARAYRAFFETFWHEPWFAGAYFWKWSPPIRPGNKRFLRIATDGPGRRPDFSPRGKPAEAVLREWYGRSSP
ncbi:MAG: glycoside hydrolase TIM-barrel-like domain-containing protein [Thermoanaerobaculia bacterium]